MPGPDGPKVIRPLTLPDVLHHLSEVAAVFHQVRSVPEQPSADKKDQVLAVGFQHFRHPVQAHSASGSGKYGPQMAHGDRGALNNIPALLAAEGEPASEVRENRRIRAPEAGKLAEDDAMGHPVPAGYEAPLESGVREYRQGD